LIASIAAVPHPRVVLSLAIAPSPRALKVPVRGIAARSLRDSWDAPRSGGRHHRGIDIFARRGTPIVSPVSGLVLDVGTNRLGGQVVTVLGPGLEVHYFAHLDRYGPVRERALVRPGDVLGYVGTTGNARGTPPHLHYGIYVLPGRAVNPYPRLAAKL
jgi:murein DD-endopeptidase MepM/ murein hydrolase activator NlpD